MALTIMALRRELCGCQHTPRLSGARCLSDHGNCRDRWCGAEPAWHCLACSRFRDRRAGLRWYGQLTGLGTFSLALPSVPPRRAADVGNHGLGARHGSGGRTFSVVDPHARTVASSDRAREPASGYLGARSAHRSRRLVGYQLVSGRSFAEVLFSGQDSLARAGRRGQPARRLA